MKWSTRREAKGKLENLKGKTKESTGIIIGDSAMEAEGKNQKLAGKVRIRLGVDEREANQKLPASQDAILGRAQLRNTSAGLSPSRKPARS